MFSRTHTAPEGQAERRQLRREKRRRLWRKTRKGLLWTLLLAIVGHMSLNIYASVQLNRELAAIRQKGEPVRFSELEPPAVPDAQNAALVYAKASKSLSISPEEKGALRVREENLSPKDEAYLESTLRKNQKSLELARQAATMPQCRFPLDWKGNPIQLTFPYYSDLRELARLLSIDARIRARSGDKSGALRDVRSLFGISHHISKEPVFIGFLVSQSINVTAHRALGKVLEHIPLTVAEARAFESSLPDTDWAHAYRQSLLGERTYGLFAFEILGQKSANEADEDDADYMPVWTKYPLLSIARPILKLDEVQILRIWRLLLDSPQSQQVPCPTAFGQSVDAAIINTPSYAMLTRILLPIFSRSSDNRDRAYVLANQREVALALSCYHTAKGSYPTQLTQAAAMWGKALPTDPYSRKDFIYRSNGKGFVLYSIGPNRVDEGGKNSQYKGKFFASTADDILWEIP